MKRIFADAGYWVALLHPGDQLHEDAAALEPSLQRVQLVTTEFVLAEFLNFYAGRGPGLRLAAARLAAAILQHSRVEVAVSDRELFRAGLSLYKNRSDKGYSLTDCISMALMRRRKITEALTQDHHFRQEGFVPLL